MTSNDQQSKSPNATGVAGIEAVILDVPDPAGAQAFYTAAFGLDGWLQFQANQTPSSGFRGFVMSLVVSQPSGVDSLVRTALDSGAIAVKPSAKSFWGYGAVVQAPDGTLWKIASSAKKDTAPVTRAVEDVVLLIGVASVKASKRFYVEQGLEVKRSFGGKYAEFTAMGSPVKLALYPRHALAKDAGVPADGSDSYGLTIGTRGAPFTDPDGFAWQPATG